MFDVIIALKEFQSRFTHPAATCDPSAWRTRRQESPRFHRGLGSPPLLLAAVVSSQQRNWRDLLKPKAQQSVSNEYFTQFPTILIHFRIQELSPCHQPAAVNQPANADQVTRMKHSWLSARSRCGSATFRPTQAACKGTYHRTDTAVLWRWFGLNFPALWWRFGRSSRASKPSWTRCLSHR